MDRKILDEAYSLIKGDIGEVLDDIYIGPPSDDEHRLLLLNIVSKVSSFMGNIFEYRYRNLLNQSNIFDGKWLRNDPDFPDLEYFSDEHPNGGLGIEIKAWFPLATEITGRFKESQIHLLDRTIDLVLIAWVPEHLFYGKPKTIGMTTLPAIEVAESRDSHYYNPPQYLLEEPEDTSGRTRNLQQRNVNGYGLQGNTNTVVKDATKMVEKLGLGKPYDPGKSQLIKELQTSFPYRLDTNFAKIDRIDNEIIESFKTNILNIEVDDQKLKDWRRSMTVD